jgi:hypothetical protein
MAVVTVLKKVSNPSRKRRSGTKKRNPALLVTLGAINPRKTGVNKMAIRRRKATKRKANSTTRRRVRRTRKSNPQTRIIMMKAPATRRRRRRASASGTSRRRVIRRSNGRRRRSYKRNPSVFGMSVGGRSGAALIGGGLAGVAGTKMLSGMIIARVPMLQGDLGRIALSLGLAYLGGVGVGKLDRTLGDAYFFGGLMQTGSVILNTFMPSLGKVFGLGELVAGSYPLPMNSITAGQMQYALPSAASNPTAAAAGMSGLSRAFGPAF